ncbi:MAG TPA: deoxyribodipyrimidine photo-lyase [Actinomycetota bacterium]|nr:deoxyribodipyrimidine photo-lyase [Actinomycetota bacterium]
MAPSVAVVLFTRDLRVHDHPALTAAVSSAERVVPLFVLDLALVGRSPNRERFLLESLAELHRALTHLGGGLLVREGTPVRVVLDVVAATGATSVHLTSDTTAYAARRASLLRDALATHGAELHVHPGNAVGEPGEVAPPEKASYAVFSPYHRAWAAVARPTVLDPPDRITLPDDVDATGPPGADRVRPESIDLPPGGEKAARRHVDAYLAADVQRYGELRNDLAADATSRFSPYLRFGCISANELVHRLAGLGGTDELIRQLAWRDFYGQLLAADPSLTHRPLREAPGDVPEPPAKEDEILARWEEGRTGIPLVDAGMRQLRREGWIHNRARMVVASFLTRRLGVPWQRGSDVFMRWLVDGDPANNAGGWQWVAGTGTDPRRSRSFNPVRQAERFDPDGAYIARYVRELADVPVPLRFAPWKEPTTLRETGYPAPLIEVPADGVERSDPGGPPFHADAPARPGQASLFTERKRPA